MFRRNLLMVSCALLTAASGLAQNRAAASQPLDITGAWTGTWSIYNPSQPAVPAKDICAKLDSTVAFKNGVWEAVFEGDCGRPYKYTIRMEGRQVGAAVLFKGTVDLGPKDGGVFDWIGRATNTEFIGFYTSGVYTGVFNLKRVEKR